MADRAGKLWSRNEVEAIVADYLDMLLRELSGEPYNKTRHRRHLKSLLEGRTEPAIELKHCNISQVMIDLGFRYIDGYKPRSNYQDLLIEVVIERVRANRELHEAAKRAATNAESNKPRVSDLLGIQVSPPRRALRREIARDRSAPRPKMLFDYLRRESDNRSLGMAGETLVVQFEQERLRRMRMPELAKRVEQVSVTQGDGLGYDIWSFDERQRRRLIEVKTTRGAELTPFFVTRNEVAVSRERPAEYCLYRLFDFDRRPRLFVLNGCIDEHVNLDAMQYRASF